MSVLSTLRYSPLIGASRFVLFASVIIGTALTCSSMQILASVLGLFNFKLANKVTTRMGGLMWYVMQYIFEKRQKALITFSGDELPHGENALVIANHQAFMDFYMLNTVAARHGMLSNLKYLAKDSLKYLPLFGWGMALMGMIFVKRNWAQDQHRIAFVFRRLCQYKIPLWLVTYPEGTRITSTKHAEAVKFARLRGFPMCEHVLVPRTKGFAASVQHLKGSHVRHLYDFTIIYYSAKHGFGYAPSIWRLHTFPLTDYRFHIHFKRYALKDLPDDGDALADWLRQVFAEKDKRLARWKKALEIGEENALCGDRVRHEVFPGLIHAIFG